MAGRGPAPKPVRSRPNDTARREAEMVKVAADGTMRGPDLPDGITWTARTSAWWLTWRMSPMAVTFTDTDWDFLLDTAMLHNELWSGNTGVAAELRLRVAKFGSTPEDRMRLKLAVEIPATQAKDAPAAKAKRARRSKLLTLVQD